MAGQHSDAYSFKMSDVKLRYEIDPRCIQTFTALLHISFPPIDIKIIIIIWRANHPYSQLRAELRRTLLQRVREAGMQGCLWLPATSAHYDHGAQPRSKVFDFFPGEENRIVCKTLVVQKRTNAQLNSHIALAGNRTGVTLVRGEHFKHKPTMPPDIQNNSQKVSTSRDTLYTIFIRNGKNIGLFSCSSLTLVG